MTFILRQPAHELRTLTASVHAFKDLVARYGKDGHIVGWCCYRCSWNVLRNFHLPNLVALGIARAEFLLHHHSDRRSPGTMRRSTPNTIN